MKLENNFGEAVETNIDNFCKFEIKATPQLFKMLSSDIYQDKILAVIRELTTNAVDAMRDAGTLSDTCTYEVTLPNVLSNTFKIRDYGTGLDEEGIKRVYTYGATSRSESNDFVGAFGIGSKSPFAYTKTGFSITSWCNGKRYDYDASLIDGVPQISKMNEEESTEPNGVEISIAVNRSDFSNFESTAKRFYSWFDVKPKINTAYDEDYVKCKASWLIDNEQFIVMRDRLDSLYEVKILMGGILYNLPPLMSGHLFQFREYYANRTVIIKAPIGRYVLQPSREYIDTVESNRKHLLEDMEVLKNSIAKYINDKVKEISSDNSLSINQRIGKITDSKKLSYLSGQSSYVFFERHVSTVDGPIFAAYKNLKNIGSCHNNLSYTMKFNDGKSCSWSYINMKLPAEKGSKRMTQITFGELFLIKDKNVINDMYGLACKSKNHGVVTHSCPWDSNYNTMFKTHPELIDEIRKHAKEDLGYDDSQIILASEWNKAHAPAKPEKANDSERINAMKIFDIEANIRNGNLSPRKIETLEHSYVLLYQGRIYDMNAYVVGNILKALMEVLKYETKLAHGGSANISFSSINVYMVHKRFEHALPKTCINIMDKIKSFLQNYTFNTFDMNTSSIISRLKRSYITGKTDYEKYCKLSKILDSVKPQMDKVLNGPDINTFELIPDSVYQAYFNTNITLLKNEITIPELLDYVKEYPYVNMMASCDITPVNISLIEAWTDKYGKEVNIKDVFHCDPW